MVRITKTDVSTYGISGSGVCDVSGSVVPGESVVLGHTVVGVHVVPGVPVVDSVVLGSMLGKENGDEYGDTCGVIGTTLVTSTVALITVTLATELRVLSIAQAI